MSRHSVASCATVPAALVAIMSYLICYCSMTTAACISYIDFLRPIYVYLYSCIYLTTVQKHSILKK